MCQLENMICVAVDWKYISYFIVLVTCNFQYSPVEKEEAKLHVYSFKCLKIQLLKLMSVKEPLKQRMVIVILTSKGVLSDKETLQSVKPLLLHLYYSLNYQILCCRTAAPQYRQPLIPYNGLILVSHVCLSDRCDTYST